MTPTSERGESMFKGSIVALVTPFTDRGGVDYVALDRLLDLHLAEGTDGVVVAGTTGESATLEETEFRELLTAVIRRVAGAIPVLAGTGGASTARSVERTRLAGELGADAALVVTPYYNRPMQAGLEAHFTAVADASAIPVVLYNVPSRTAVDLQPETVGRLAAHARIVGVKEAVADPSRIARLVDICGPGFAVLSGDDPSCLQAMKRGACGVVSVAANVAPRLLHELCAAAAAPAWPQAERIDQRLRPLFSALAVETNPIPVKWALFEMGLVGTGLRLPLTPLATEHRAALRRCLQELGLVSE